MTTTQARDFAQEELVAETAHAVAERVAAAQNVAVFPVRQAAPVPIAPDTVAARARLASAISTAAEAAALLDDARSATARARALVAETAAEAERLHDIDREIADDRAAGIAAAIRSGQPPIFAAAPALTETAAALADAENRKHAAKAVVVTLAAEERDAERRVAEARDGVASAVKTVLCAEAEELASLAAEADRRATALRCQIGTGAGFVGNLPAPMSETLRRILAANDESRMVDGNAPLGRAARTASTAWRDFAARLAADANAVLRFDA